MCGKAVARAFGIKAPSLPPPPQPAPPPTPVQAQQMAEQQTVPARERVMAGMRRAAPAFGADTFGGSVPGVARRRLFGE